MCTWQRLPLANLDDYHDFGRFHSHVCWDVLHARNDVVLPSLMDRRIGSMPRSCPWQICSLIPTWVRASFPTRRRQSARTPKLVSPPWRHGRRARALENKKPPNRLPDLREDLLSEAQRSVLKRLQAKRGRVPTPYRIWIQSPALAEPLEELGTQLSESVRLSKPEREIAILLIAQHWHADYVFEVHVREAKEAGLSEALIAEIRNGATSHLADPLAMKVYRVSPPV